MIHVFTKRLEYTHMKSIVWNRNEFYILFRLMNLFYQSCESHENKHDEYFENKYFYHVWWFYILIMCMMSCSDDWFIFNIMHEKWNVRF